MEITIQNPRPERVVVGNDVMLDGRLSWDARGIFIHLAQLPNGTVLTKDSLSSNTISTMGSVKAALTLLKTTGYIELTKTSPEKFIAKLKPVSYERRPMLPKKPMDGDLKHFDEFWGIYPRRHAKIAAKAVWARKNLDVVSDVIVTGLKRQLANGGFSDDPKFIPHPSTWLNQERWVDETASNRQPAPTDALGRPVFRVMGKTYTVDSPPKRDEFGTDGEFATYSQSYKAWKAAIK